MGPFHGGRHVAQLCFLASVNRNTLNAFLVTETNLSEGDRKGSLWNPDPSFLPVTHWFCFLWTELVWLLPISSLTS